MKSLPDDLVLASLTIPGTHNSAALHEPFPGTATCQSLSLKEQLEAGVRFFDLRCRHVNDRFHLYHGPIDQKLSFAEALKTFEEFLKTEPKEFLLISIQGAAKASKTTRDFEATFKDSINPKKWWLKSPHPSTGEARGKMILIRRFDSKAALGISATNWKSNRHHSTKQLVIQDHFQPKTPTEKWKAIEGLFAMKEPEKLHLNFTSGYLKGSFGIPQIQAVSDPINRKLKNYVTTAEHRPHGVLALDFITPNLAKAIWQLNFPEE